MLKHNDPEVRSLTLLIQLFGREVLDQLREAGFASPLAIARAGPEMLAEQGGIALPLARRIVAVAMETEGIGELSDPQDGVQAPPVNEAGPAASAQDGDAAVSAVAEGVAGPGMRRRHRPGPGDRGDSVPKDVAPAAKGRGRAAKRQSAAGISDRKGAATRTGGSPAPAGHTGDSPGPAGKTAPDPDAGVEISGPDIEMSGRRGSTRDAGKSRSGSAELNGALDDSDPFVDDVALISWMGFSARTGRDHPSSIAVADEILDPVVQPTASVAPMEPDGPAGPGVQVESASPVEPVSLVEPAPPARPAPEADDQRLLEAPRPSLRKGTRFTVAGSFWSYGRRFVPPIPSEEGPDR